MSEPTPSVPVVQLPSRRVVAGVVLLLAGLLAIGGTFAALYSFTVSIPLGLSRFSHTFVVTSWVSDYPTTYGLGFSFTSSSRTNYFGVPALVAGAIALYGADLLLRRRDATPRQLTQARLFAIAAASLVAGYVWFGVTNLIDSIASSAAVSSYTFDTGAGIWLLIAAALLGALSFVLMLGLTPEAVPVATTAEEEVVVYQVDVDTPPMGFEVPVNLPPTDTYQPPEKPQTT
jgi:hypothetical protein